MAKLGYDRRQRVRATDRVREIRQRYSIAIELGHSVAEASRLANGFEKIERPENAPPKVSLPRLPLPESPEKEERDGEDTPNSKPKFNVPPNYQDLPWPRLVELAKNITRSQEHIRSRAQACQMIEAKLNEEET